MCGRHILLLVSCSNWQKRKAQSAFTVLRLTSSIQRRRHFLQPLDGSLTWFHVETLKRSLTRASIELCSWDTPVVPRCTRDDPVIPAICASHSDYSEVVPPIRFSSSRSSTSDCTVSARKRERKGESSLRSSLNATLLVVACRQDTLSIPRRPYFERRTREARAADRALTLFRVENATERSPIDSYAIDAVATRLPPVSTRAISHVGIFISVIRA